MIDWSNEWFLSLENIFHEVIQTRQKAMLEISQMMLVRHMLKHRSQSEHIDLSQLGSLGCKHIYHTIHNQARPKEEKNQTYIFGSCTRI